MTGHAQRLARCAMTTALGVTLMTVLGLTGVATYLAPLAASLLLIPIQRSYGTRLALTVWLATGLLTLMLVTDKELAGVYLSVLGWYPALRPALERLPPGLRAVVKLALFHLAALGGYWVMLALLGLGEELGGPWEAAVLLLLGNVLFQAEDRLLIPRLLRFLDRGR